MAKNVESENLAAAIESVQQLRAGSKSLLMDEETANRWKDELGHSGNGRSLAMPPNLTEAERAAFLLCDEKNLRIEQERFPQGFIVEFLQSRLTG